MTEPAESAAVLALIQNGRRPMTDYTALFDRASALELLDREHGLLAPQLLERAADQIETWRGEGIELVTVRDARYPVNLQVITHRPPLIFLAGHLQADDTRSLAVIGSRRATPAGCQLARQVAGCLVHSGYTINSGLAAGIDTAAHTEALARGGRTVAVIGTGLNHCYPRSNASLQRTIAQQGAVVSTFLPDTPPSPENFRLRNGVMAGLSLATVIVEASLRSGARLQARLALSQGRPVLLAGGLLEQDWARQLSGRPGVHIWSSPDEIPSLVERLVREPPTS